MKTKGDVKEHSLGDLIKTNSLALHTMKKIEAIQKTNEDMTEIHHSIMHGSQQSTFSD